MANSDPSMVLGFTGLDFTTGVDSVTAGSLHFKIKDRPTNVDKHMALLAKLIKSDVVLSLENDKLVITVKENKDGNNAQQGSNSSVK
jgi:hypothetical protein